MKRNKCQKFLEKALLNQNIKKNMIIKKKHLTLKDPEQVFFITKLKI